VGLSRRQLWGWGLLFALSKVGGTEICQAHAIAQRCIIGGESHHLGNSRKSRHRRWRRRAPGPQLLEAALSASARARGESGPARLSLPPWAVFPSPLRPVWQSPRAAENGSEPRPGRQQGTASRISQSAGPHCHRVVLLRPTKGRLDAHSPAPRPAPAWRRPKRTFRGFNKECVPPECLGCRPQRRITSV